MVTFTPLHRALGIAPSPLTNEILDSAIAAGITESDDLDWKSELPPAKNMSQTDIPKDIAAMANSGGGMIVYGVDEDQKAAVGRNDTGEFTETHERAFRSIAITAISPPLFGLEIYRLGTDTRAVAVAVPASVDGPHLIYRNDYFGAPIRNDADTVWMKERQIEAMYRARFDERRRATESLDSLFAEIAESFDSENRAWLVAVAHPRIPSTLVRPTRDDAREIFEQACKITLTYSNRNGVHPLENVDHYNPRPGLRRWTAPNSAVEDNARWREAWASVHHDGSVTLAAAVGGHRKSIDGYFEGWQIEGSGIECSIADFAALIRATSTALHHDEYEVRVGIEWTGNEALNILTTDNFGLVYEGASTPLQSYKSLRSTINAAAPNSAFHQQVYELAQDCINQGGLSNLHVIAEAPDSEI